MKRWLRILLCSFSFTLLFAFLGCSKGQNRNGSALEKWMTEDDKLKVLSTTAMIDDIVAKIGGDKIDHLSLIIGEVDPHSYELVKGDDEKLARADLLFHNGLGLEHGASLRYRIDHHPNAIALGEKIRELSPEKILYRKGQIDPHIWMDVELWSLSIDPIVHALSKKMPQEADYFQNRGILLKEEMLKVHNAIIELFHRIPPQKRYLVTSHDAFQYFTRSYLSEQGEGDWQKRFTAPEGLAPEGQISLADIQVVIDYLLQYRIKHVFPESNVSKDALRKIVEACRSHGHSIEIANTSLHGDAMGAPGSSAGGYMEMMWHNATILAKAWQGEEKS